MEKKFWKKKALYLGHPIDVFLLLVLSVKEEDEEEDAASFNWKKFSFIKILIRLNFGEFLPKFSLQNVNCSYPNVGLGD